MTINLVVENIGGLGVKATRKRKNWGQNLHKKFMCQESYQKQGLVQSNNIEYDN